jgi:hypothetical protein
MTRRLAVIAVLAALNGTAVRAQTPAASIESERGAQLDTSGFRYQRPLARGDAGLVVLPLDAAVLAHSQGPLRRFADVRIVDGSGAQIPYLLERRADRLSMDLQLRRASPQSAELQERRGNRSFYALTLPYANLPGPVIALHTSALVFRRPLQIGVERPPGRRRRDVSFAPLAQTVWEHRDPSAAPPPLELALPLEPSRELLLIVDEGDNRPLPITAAGLLLPGWQVRFHRPAGTVTVLYGKEEMTEPHYDIAALSPSSMMGDAREVAAEAERGGTAPARMISPPAFWIGLGAAVVVLLGVLVRLMASGAGPPRGRPGR